MKLTQNKRKRVLVLVILAVFIFLYGGSAVLVYFPNSPFAKAANEVIPNIPRALGLPPTGIVQSAYSECFGESSPGSFEMTNFYSCTALLPNPVTVGDQLVVGVVMNNETGFVGADCFTSGTDNCFVSDPLSDGVYGSFYGAPYTSVSGGSSTFNTGMLTDMGWVNVTSSSMATFFDSDGMFMEAGIYNATYLTYMFVSVFEVSGLNTTNAFGTTSNGFGHVYNVDLTLPSDASRALFFGTITNNLDSAMTQNASFSMLGTRRTRIHTELYRNRCTWCGDSNHCQWNY